MTMNLSPSIWRSCWLQRRPTLTYAGQVAWPTSCCRTSGTRPCPRCTWTQPSAADHNETLHAANLAIQGAYRTLTVVFHDFPRPFMSIFHVFPGLFNQVDIKQVRLSYACTKSTKQQIEPSLTIMYVKAENIYTGQKCGLFSITFQNIGLIPRLSRPGKFEF